MLEAAGVWGEVGCCCAVSPSLVVLGCSGRIKGERCMRTRFALSLRAARSAALRVGPGVQRRLRKRLLSSSESGQGEVLSGLGVGVAEREILLLGLLLLLVLPVRSLLGKGVDGRGGANVILMSRCVIEVGGE